MSYILQAYDQGYDFFNNWGFFSGSDPTNGNVVYLNADEATSSGLAYVTQRNTLILAVDSTSTVPVGGNRDSTRIQSYGQWTGGLFIMDAIHMPVGCGTWPSFWSNGPNWPLGGEIDIVEGINDQLYNQMTLHSGTSNPCKVSNTAHNPFTGHLLNANCYSTQTADAGCSILDSSPSSFAYGFNNVGGGVFALEWNASAGMSMWHFPRANIPADITNEQPEPSGWGTPSGFWSAATCDIQDNFYQHTFIFDTTICGGWAGGAYNKSGCPGTCAEMVANSSNFANAYWEINYFAVYE